MNNGIFILSELEGATCRAVRDIQRRFDPRLAAGPPPHITLVGSSGVGPIPLDTSAERLAAALGPIARETPPITVHFERPHRFMQTNIIVLPLDPHGPLRALHERIATSGLPFARARFPFSPHCTLSYYPTLSPGERRDVLAARVEEPVVIHRLRCYATVNPQPGRLVLDLELGRG